MMVRGRDVEGLDCHQCRAKKEVMNVATIQRGRIEDLAIGSLAAMTKEEGL